jgi:hypothetical protein
MEGKEDPDKLAKLAAEAFKERDYLQALEYYRKALLLRPFDPELTNQKIKCEYIVKRQGNVFQKVMEKIQENKVESQETAVAVTVADSSKTTSTEIKPKKEAKTKAASNQSPKKASKASKKSKKK